MRTVNVNKDNVEQLFEKAMDRIDREIEVAVACYRWAERNDYDERWTKAAGDRLTRALGVKIEDFQAAAYTFGKGDVDLGCDLIKRFGAGRLDDARKSLSKRDLEKLLKRIDNTMTTKLFDEVSGKLLSEARQRASEAGKRLNDARRGIEVGDGKIAGQIINYRKAYEVTKELLGQEKQRRLAAEKRAEELQKKVEELTEKLVATG